MEKEQWIKFAEPGYFVSNLGRFKSEKFVKYRNNKIINELKVTMLKPNLALTGYFTVSVNRKNLYAHRIIANVFIPNPNNYPVVNHINGIRNDNSFNNLEWCTQSQNIKHAYTSGLVIRKKGEFSTNKKLKNIDVLEIRKQYSLGITPKKIAINYPVSASTISNIVARRLWNHI